MRKLFFFVMMIALFAAIVAPAALAADSTPPLGRVTVVAIDDQNSNGVWEPDTEGYVTEAWATPLKSITFIVKGKEVKIWVPAVAPMSLSPTGYKELELPASDAGKEYRFAVTAKGWKGVVTPIKKLFPGANSPLLVLLAPKCK